MRSQVSGIKSVKSSDHAGIRLVAARGVALTLLLLPCQPSTALAHASERGIVMLLPTHYYLLGGTLAVAISFIVLGLVPVSWMQRALTWRSRELSFPATIPLLLSWVSFCLMVFLIYTGFAGNRDPLSNLLPLTIWTVWWIGLTLLHGAFGNLWAIINPWNGPYWLGSRLFSTFLTTLNLSAPARVTSQSQEPQRYMPLPQAWAYGLACIGFAAFAWFELIALAPDDPAVLAMAVTAYWVYTFAGMIVCGQQDWSERAECFAVFFRLVSRLAMIQPSANRTGLAIAAPGAGVISHPPLPVSGVLFLLLTLASVSFDGVSKTFWWLGLNGINPLAFPGRSAVSGINTVGLAVTFMGFASAYAFAIWLGWQLAGRHGALAGHVGRFVLPIIPISLAFHAAHYLTVLLINGQYVLVAASDPLNLGYDLLGYTDYRVTGSWLTDFQAVALIWKLQASVIVLGHIFAVGLSHALAVQHYTDRRRTALSQLPLTSLMVAYTGLGLWLLATPVAG